MASETNAPPSVLNWERVKEKLGEYENHGHQLIHLQDAILPVAIAFDRVQADMARQETEIDFLKQLVYAVSMRARILPKDLEDITASIRAGQSRSHAERVTEERRDNGPPQVGG